MKYQYRLAGVPLLALGVIAAPLAPIGGLLMPPIGVQPNSAGIMTPSYPNSTTADGSKATSVGSHEAITASIPEHTGLLGSIGRAPTSSVPEWETLWLSMHETEKARPHSTSDDRFTTITGVAHATESVADWEAAWLSKHATGVPPHSTTAAPHWSPTLEVRQANEDIHWSKGWYHASHTPHANSTIHHSHHTSHTHHANSTAYSSYRPISRGLPVHSFTRSASTESTSSKQTHHSLPTHWHTLPAMKLADFPPNSIISSVTPISVPGQPSPTLKAGGHGPVVHGGLSSSSQSSGVSSLPSGVSQSASHTVAPRSVISSSSVIPISQISDGQPQAPVTVPSIPHVSGIPRGPGPVVPGGAAPSYNSPGASPLPSGVSQGPFPTVAPHSVISSVTPISEISDGQPQAPATGVPSVPQGTASKATPVAGAHSSYSSPGASPLPSGVSQGPFPTAANANLPWPYGPKLPSGLSVAAPVTTGSGISQGPFPTAGNANLPWPY